MVIVVPRRLPGVNSNATPVDDFGILSTARLVAPVGGALCACHFADICAAEKAGVVCADQY